MVVMALPDLKVELQTRGVRMAPGAGGVPRIRRGGAGPAEGITLLVGGSPTSVPFTSRFAASSPFVMERHEGGWRLLHAGRPVGACVAPVEPPAFYGLETAEGVPLEKIALFHGADCMASTVLQACAYWGTPVACRFCGIGLSLQAGATTVRKRPDELAEAACAAAGCGARHVTLTAGSTLQRCLEAELYEAASRAIVQASGLPVHVQLMPPVSRKVLERLRRAGVRSLGIHRESFDPAVLKRVAPCKARIAPDLFLQAWRDGVHVFGRGQVSSFLLLGLGESADGLLDGCRDLARLGVYPYAVPFRPIPGTRLGGAPPADASTLRRVLPRIARTLEEQGLDWGDVHAGCVRCRACSALPDYQDARARARARTGAHGELAWEVVASGPFLEMARAIRHEVFVEEQGLFRETDRDGRDPDSLHILARYGSRCVGTVRITHRGGGAWVGSRLAVLPGWRGRVGARLVARAEREVMRRGGRFFSAYIQRPRVPFFRRCGWRTVEEVDDYHGVPHTVMAADGPLWAARARVSAVGEPQQEDRETAVRVCS